MAALLAWLLGNPAIAGFFAAIVGGIAWGFRQRLAGAEAVRKKQAAEEAKARDVSDKVEGDVDALPAKQARDELKEWWHR